MHNVETMVYANQYAGDMPWHGLGTPCDHVMTSAEALELSGANWNVEARPVYVEGITEPVAHLKANVRDVDEAILGIVSDRYKIVQNSEAFAFTDMLLANDRGIDIRYETAIVLDHGKKVCLLAHLPSQLVLGDKVEPYIAFVNSHDGLGAVRVAMMPTRVVCQNTLTLGLSLASRTWSTRHTGDLNSKLVAAQNTLDFAMAYMTGFVEHADEMQQQKLSVGTVDHFVSSLFPVEQGMSDRQLTGVLEQRRAFREIYDSKPDLAGFKNTAWGVYNAVSDFETHLEPRRASTTFREHQFLSFVDSNTRLTKAEKLLAAL